MPKLINLHDTNGIVPPGATRIDRRTKWGNRFKIGEIQDRVMSRDDVVKAHRDWLLYSNEGRELLLQIEELRGKDLACWCANERCHGDNYFDVLYHGLRP